jgi:hypothetical protein
MFVPGGALVAGIIGVLSAAYGADVAGEQYVASKAGMAGEDITRKSVADAEWDANIALLDMVLSGLDLGSAVKALATTGKAAKGLSAADDVAKGAQKSKKASETAPDLERGRRATTATPTGPSGRVFKTLAAAKDWAVETLEISARFAEDLGIAGINKLASLTDDLLEQFRTLSTVAKRILCGCRSPCVPVLPRIRKALQNLKRIKRPRTAREFIRPGPERAREQISARLLELARLKRSLVGISQSAFKKLNVAVGRFVIDGKDYFVTVVNKTGERHAEEVLLERLNLLRKQHGKENVTLAELLTERIPCGPTGGMNIANCRTKLWTESPETKTFFLVSGSTASDLSTSKARFLMEVYGVKASAATKR